MINNYNKQNPYNQPEMQQYFSTLPPIIKESIEQSGMEFKTVDDLQAFVDNIYR